MSGNGNRATEKHGDLRVYGVVLPTFMRNIEPCPRDTEIVVYRGVQQNKLINDHVEKHAHVWVYQGGQGNHNNMLGDNPLEGTSCKPTMNGDHRGFVHIFLFSLQGGAPQ